MRGLGSLWHRVVKDIEWLASNNCYERVNRMISLFLVGRLRRRAARLLAGSRVIVDAGAGPGMSSSVVADVARPDLLVLVDPSPLMLTMASGLLEGRPILHVEVVGVFESLPLSPSVADGLVSMFAFRDALDYEQAVREFCRTLKPEGILVILDLFNPDNAVERALIKTHLRLVPPLAAVLSGCPRAARQYRDLAATLDRMPRLSELLKMVGYYFGEVAFNRVAPGTMLLIARRPLKERCRG